MQGLSALLAAVTTTASHATAAHARGARQLLGRLNGCYSYSPARMFSVGG